MISGDGKFSALPGQSCLNQNQCKGNTVKVVALDKLGKIDVRAGAAKISFYVIAPTSVSLYPKYHSSNSVGHTENHPNSAIHAEVFVGPDTVNFYRVNIRELDVIGIPSIDGVYSGACNPFDSGHCGLGGNNTPCQFSPLTGIRVGGKGMASTVLDCASSGDPVIKCNAVGPFKPGRVTLNIPYEYNAKPPAYGGKYYKFTEVIQVHTLEGDGYTLTSSKAGSFGKTEIVHSDVPICNRGQP
jgi:hypothetical protein